MAAVEAIDSIGSTRATTATRSSKETAAARQESPEIGATVDTTDTVEVSDEAAEEQTAAPEAKVPEQAPPGFDQTKWNDPNHQTPKYIVGRVIAANQDKLKSVTDPAQHRALAESLLKSTIPAIEKAGGTVLQVKNDKLLLDMNDGTGPHWCDAIRDSDAGGDNAPSWCVIDDNASDPATQGVPTGQAAPAQGTASTQGTTSQGSQAGPVADYLLGLVRSGMDPQQACQMANQKFNLKTGGEAVYYPENNTIGLPNCYLAGPTNKPDSPAEWGITMRGQGGGASVGNGAFPSLGNFGGFPSAGSFPSVGELGGWGSSWGGQAGAPAAGGFLSGLMGMFGMGASQGLQADPEVGRIVARVTAAGGQVLRVDRRFVLAEMGKGQGPLWIPVHGRRQAPAQRQAWIA